VIIVPSGLIVKISPDLVGKCATNYVDLARDIINIANEIDAQYAQVSGILQGSAGAKFLSAYAEIRQSIVEVSSKIASTGNYLNYVVASYVNADNSYENIPTEDYNRVLQYMNDTMKKVGDSMKQNNNPKDDNPNVVEV